MDFIAALSPGSSIFPTKFSSPERRSSSFFFPRSKREVYAEHGMKQARESKMKRELAMNVNFGGLRQDLQAMIQLKSPWDAVKKACATCLMAWLLALMLVFVPFINWTLPAIFFVFGPILGLAAYLADRRAIERLDAHLVCPHCKSEIDILERRVSTPLFGHCPHCHTAYQIHLPELEYRD